MTMLDATTKDGTRLRWVTPAGLGSEAQRCTRLRLAAPAGRDSARRGRVGTGRLSQTWQGVSGQGADAQAWIGSASRSSAQQRMAGGVRMGEASLREKWPDATRIGMAGAASDRHGQALARIGVIWNGEAGPARKGKAWPHLETQARLRGDTSIADGTGRRDVASQRMARMGQAGLTGIGQVRLDSARQRCDRIVGARIGRAGVAMRGRPGKAGLDWRRGMRRDQVRRDGRWRGMAGRKRPARLGWARRDLAGKVGFDKAGHGKTRRRQARKDGASRGYSRRGATSQAGLHEVSLGPDRRGRRGYDRSSLDGRGGATQARQGYECPDEHWHGQDGQARTRRERQRVGRTGSASQASPGRAAFVPERERRGKAGASRRSSAGTGYATQAGLHVTWSGLARDGATRQRRRGQTRRGHASARRATAAQVRIGRAWCDETWMSADGTGRPGAARRGQATHRRRGVGEESTGKAGGARPDGATHRNAGQGRRGRTAIGLAGRGQQRHPARGGFVNAPRRHGRHARARRGKDGMDKARQRQARQGAFRTATDWRGDAGTAGRGRATTAAARIRRRDAARTANASQASQDVDGSGGTTIGRRGKPGIGQAWNGDERQARKRIGTAGLGEECPGPAGPHDGERTS